MRCPACSSGQVNTIEINLDAAAVQLLTTSCCSARVWLVDGSSTSREDVLDLIAAERRSIRRPTSSRGRH